jgi:predicted nucleic acid-binding protein
VALDNILDRGGFADDAMRIIELCELKIINGYMSASMVTDMFYVARKTILRDLLYTVLEDFFEVIEICDVTKNEILSALHRHVRDFEDAVQDECANKIGADYIVTRNPHDFTASKVEAVTPSEFLKLA